jgi:hypothetical protein
MQYLVLEDLKLFEEFSYDLWQSDVNLTLHETKITVYHISDKKFWE